MGRSTAAVVTLDTVADDSKKMADGVTTSPTRLCSRDGTTCYYRRLENDFLLLCLASLSRYTYLLRVPSSVQQSSATLSKYVCTF